VRERVSRAIIFINRKSKEAMVLVVVLGWRKRTTTMTMIDAKQQQKLSKFLGIIVPRHGGRTRIGRETLASGCCLFA